jgi:hypothetical protein
MQRYTLKPGNFIQTCRKLPDSIKNSEIPEISIKYCEEIFSKVSISSVKEVDKSRVVIHLYRMIQAALNFYHSLNRSQILKREEISSTRLSLIPANYQNFSGMNADSRENSKSTLNRDSISFEYLIDMRFQEFLKTYQFPDVQDISARLQILDDFLFSIRKDLRASILPALNPIFE